MRDAPTTSMSVVDLIRQTSPWSDWMADKDIGSLSTWRFVALLLRELPVEVMIERLAPALLNADRNGQRFIIQYLHQCWIDEGDVFGFEHWLEMWENGAAGVYGEAALDAIARLDGSGDIRHFATVMIEESVEPSALLWFLLGAIQGWVTSGGNIDRLAPSTRWLAELYEKENSAKDPLGVLLAWLYGRFRASGSCETKPLPEDLAITSEAWPLHYDSSAPAPPAKDDVLREAYASVQYHGRTPTLADLLGSDARAWPKAASGLGWLRKHGLISPSAFSLTPLGQEQIDIEHAWMDSPNDTMRPLLWSMQ